MVVVTKARPFAVDLADSLKSAIDCAVLVTLILCIVLKLDLTHEPWGGSEPESCGLLCWQNRVLFRSQEKQLEPVFPLKLQWCSDSIFVSHLLKQYFPAVAGTRPSV